MTKVKELKNDAGTLDNINKIAFKKGILPIYRINENSIQIFEENYDLCCNFFKDSHDRYIQKKNVYIESSFKVGNDRAGFGIRLVDDEIDEFTINLNTRTFMMEKQDDKKITKYQMYTKNGKKGFETSKLEIAKLWIKKGGTVKTSDMKIKELKYPDECANCKADACSDCGHRQKRADTIDKYEKQFCKLCGKFIIADVNKYPDEFDKNLCSDCNVEYVA